MTKELKVNISDEWYHWIEAEILHRDQSESELIEDALAAFLAELQANVQRLQDEARREKRLAMALEPVFNDSARITRRHWNNRSIYCSLHESRLCISGFDDSGKNDLRPHPWTITESDWFSDDWEVIE